MTTQITAIEAAFDISSQGKTKTEKIDMLLDYISNTERQKAKSTQSSLLGFYQSEIDAAKNKLKQISID